MASLFGEHSETSSHSVAILQTPTAGRVVPGVHLASSMERISSLFLSLSPELGGSDLPQNTHQAARSLSPRRPPHPQPSWHVLLPGTTRQDAPWQEHSSQPRGLS